MQQEALATFVDIILPLNLPRLYTYRVQQEFIGQITPGKRVIVQFGATRIYSAIIFKIHHQPPEGYTAKYINYVLDDEPVVSDIQLRFWEWISEYYLSSLGEVMDAALPPAFKLASESRIYADPQFDRQLAELDDREFLVLDALDLQNQLTIAEVGKILDIKNVFPIIRSLLVKGAILIREEIQEKYKPKLVKIIRFTAAYQQEEALHQLLDKLSSKEKPLMCVMAFLQLHMESESVLRSALLEKSGVSESVLKTLIKNGVFEMEEIPIDRLSNEIGSSPDYHLSLHQSEAKDAIIASWKEKDTCLLYGANSSGKTYIYADLIRETIAQGKQVLVLLPELAVASQITDRLRRLTQAEMSAYHSRFTSNEKVEIWNKVRQNQLKLIVGARSALFLPFHSLGLVIIDEEHDSSYKQIEPAPRYHARDSAIMLASLHKAQVLLGSSTPSFESYFNAQSGKFGLVALPERFEAVPPPDISVISMSALEKSGQLKGNISVELFQAMKTCLEQGKQILLFHNRRGYSQLLQCDRCEWVMKCKHCDISLSYHRYNNSMHCHYCNQIYSIPPICPACAAPHLSFKGSGTEKIEDEIQILFPQARIGRLDMDAMKTRLGYEQIIRDVEVQKTDILIGTQMIVKGLDFDHVGLVGVIHADQLLYFPDFRAYERAYQVLSQVSGRSGRRKEQGKSIIQAGKPAHLVLQAVQSGHFEMLYKNEMQERARFGYPPFNRLIKVSLKHTDNPVVEEASKQLVRMLDSFFGDTMLGPAIPFVARIRNKYIRDILFKCDKRPYHLAIYKKRIKDAVRQLLTEKKFKQLQVVIDVDPT